MPSGHLSILVKFLLSQKNRTEAVEIDHVKTLDNAEGDTYGDLPVLITLNRAFTSSQKLILRTKGCSVPEKLLGCNQ